MTQSAFGGTLPDDLFVDEAEIERQRKPADPDSPRTESEKRPYAQTPEALVKDRGLDWLHSAKERLWWVIRIETRHGKHPAPIKNEHAAAVGIDKQYKMKLLRKFAARSLIRLVMEGNTPWVTINPGVAAFFRH
jgi:hypothetical protein